MSDDLASRAAQAQDEMRADLARMRREDPEAAAELDRLEGRPVFETLDGDRYRLTVPEVSAVFELDHLRRERHQLKGELLVRCELPGARTRGGVLMVGDVNLSAPRARKTFTGLLAERARTKDEVDWTSPLEELAERVLEAEREGEDDVNLAEVEPPGPELRLHVGGLTLPRHHPTIVFGDGDAGKSYLLLWLLGRLGADGLRVGLADWELTQSDHAERLHKLFGADPPEVRYLRCQRPIVAEADRLRRWSRERHLDYIGFDSVAYACAGAPESAEVAMDYFRAVRQLVEVGSLHVAHVTKNLEHSDRRPFGSSFWYNTPRALYFAKAAEPEPGAATKRIGLYPRKFSNGPYPTAAGFKLSFHGEMVAVESMDVAGDLELAASLTIRQRMAAALRRGAMNPDALADEVEAKVETVKRTARRYRQQFTVLDGGKLALLETRR